MKFENYREQTKQDGLFERKDIDDYYMDICNVVKTRSTCIRRQVGAVIVKDNKIISTGYNGAPRGLKDCSQNSCERERLGIPSGERYELCQSVHAEQNAIIQAAYNGVSTNGATLYCNMYPCHMCAKMILNAGIVKVIYQDVDSFRYDVFEKYLHHIEGGIL